MEFVAGCIGGMAGCLFSHPLDTIKVRMQCLPKSTYTGIIDCFSQTLRNESARGLYRGLASPLCTISLTNALCFGTFGYLLKRCNDPTSVGAHFLAGAGTGFVMSPLSGTIEMLKCKMQMQEMRGKKGGGLSTVRWCRQPVYNFTGPLACMKTIYKREGYKGLHRGLLATLARRTPGMGLYFASNEWLKQLYLSYNQGVDQLPIWYMFLAGGIAGCVGWAALYPIDVIKSRIQSDGAYNPLRKRFVYRYSGYADCIHKSVKAEGYSVFYRGISSTFLRTFPNNGVILTVVALIRNAFRNSSASGNSNCDDMAVADMSSEM